MLGRVPWMTAAGRSGPTRAPARSGSVTACWPHRRKSEQDVQSCAIFSGTQMCGTIVKPMRTKCEGSCANAQSVENPRSRPLGGHALDELRSDLAAAEPLVNHQRSHLRHVAAERREFSAAYDRVLDERHHEPRRVLTNVVEAPRQKMTCLEIVDDQSMDLCRVGRAGGPECH